MLTLRGPRTAGLMRQSSRIQRMFGVSIAVICTTCLSAVDSLPPPGPSASGFPEQYVSRDASSGVVRVWKRLYRYVDVHGNNPDPGLKLLQPKDGIALAYTSAGPAIKPGTELTPMELLRSGLQHKPSACWATGISGFLLCAAPQAEQHVYASADEL